MQVKTLTPPNLLQDKRYIEHFNELPNILFSFFVRNERLMFNTIKDEQFLLNCILIESKLPTILSEIVLIQKDNKLNTNEIIGQLIASNPMNYDLSMGHKFYEVKLYNFLYYYVTEYYASQLNSSKEELNKVESLDMFFDQEHFKISLFNKIWFHVQKVESTSKDLLYYTLGVKIAA